LLCTQALSGKTSIIKRIVEGREARIPTTDDRTIGVDIYPWKPGKEKLGYEKPDMNCQIDVQEDIRSRLKAPIDVKFSLMDFAGQDVYHVRKHMPLPQFCHRNPTLFLCNKRQPTSYSFPVKRCMF
jgi:GTPase SAR1 family protein